jgi:hypothetical protein
LTYHLRCDEALSVPWIYSRSNLWRPRAIQHLSRPPYSKPQALSDRTKSARNLRLNLAVPPFYGSLAVPDRESVFGRRLSAPSNIFKHRRGQRRHHVTVFNRLY